jgi:hypothetical protein
MGAAEFVIPFAALVIPIALILLAVIVDVVTLLWYGFSILHDEWAVPVGRYVRSHFVRPFARRARPA